jgi:hypothetical protein
MAIRALIGFISTDAAGNQVLTSTYNHYDGYPESLGKGLDKYYSSFEKAREIASMGYISYLDSETGEIEAKNKKPADQTELTDDFIEAMMRVAEQGDSYSANYIYIYDTVNDEWVNVSLRGGIRDAQEKLMDQLPDLRYDFMSGGDEVNEDYNAKWQKFLNENTVQTAMSQAMLMLQDEPEFMVNAYKRSLENDIRLNGEEQYEDFTAEDFIEDYYNYADEKMDL